MCSGMYGCEKCPLRQADIEGTYVCDSGITCFDYKGAEPIIMTWAAEHPEPVYPTWEEWLLDNGVFEPDNVLLNGKRRFYMEGKPVLNIPTKKIYDRIPADIAEKLGLKPKEGGLWRQEVK